MKNKIWFKRKLYGWGWTPCSWEGWLVIVVYFIFFYFTVRMMHYYWIKNFIVMALSIFILILICYKKGEKPRWQWGKRKED